MHTTQRFNGRTLLAGLLLLTVATPLVQAQNDTKPTVIASGKLKRLAHATKGNVSIIKNADGKHLLRFSSFSIESGPALKVYLVSGNDGSKDSVIKKGGIVDLGKLKAERGDQSYEIPSGTDLKKYQSVSIWCTDFSSNLAAATLKPKK